MTIDWKHLGKSLLACAAGAFAVSAIYYLFVKIDAVLEPVEWDEVDQSLLVSAVVGTGTFAALVLIGLPVQYFLQLTGKVSILWHVVPATLAGVVFSLLLVFMDRADGGASLWVVGTGSLMGLVSGTVAWLVRRPDKDAAKIPDPASHF